MEYFPYGDLNKYVESDFSEEGVRQVSSQLILGLRFMHDDGYAHRDLKPGVSRLKTYLSFVASPLAPHLR
jgi:serine/threonine protein kinase